jgi:small-conductance mechanosensitive channel
MPDFLNTEGLGNTVLNYIIFAAAVIVSWFVIKIVGHFLFKRLIRWSKTSEKPSTEMIARDIKKYLMPAAYFAAFYLSSKVLVLGTALVNVVSVIVTAAIIIFAAIFISVVVIYLISRYWESREQTTDNRRAVQVISVIIKIVVWTVAGVLFLESIGQPINTLIAGLGIGGIAIAFAAQAVLGDVFCYFTIFFDRPFEIGDFIVAGKEMGTVEHIGVKTTRVRALSGEQLVFSNKDLTNSRIQNYKTMQQRRVLFTLGVTFDTPYEKLTELPAMIKGVIESVEHTQFDRAHFAAYGDFSLNFEVVYYILSSDYNTYMDIHQKVNLGIMEKFQSNGIAFAYPTRTIYLEGADQ